VVVTGVVSAGSGGYSPVMRVMLLGLLGVVAIAASAWWLVGGPGSALDDTAPIADACAAATLVPPAPSGDVVRPEVRWAGSELPADLLRDRLMGMYDVTAWEGGWVASGSTADVPSRGLVFTSATGRSWTRSPEIEGQFEDVELRWLHATPERLVMPAAIWPDDLHGAGEVWSSPDGVTWTASNGQFADGWFSAIGGSADLLILGAREELGAHAWTSSDGLAWLSQPVELPVPLDNVAFSAVERVGAEWLAIGQITPRGPAGPSTPAIFRSVDGAAWTCHLLDAAGFERVAPDALHRAARGWVAMGRGSDICADLCDSSGILWTSSDGRTWSQAMVNVGPTRIGGIVYAGSAIGVLAVGHGTTWWSPTGAEWTELDAGRSADALRGQPDAMALTDDGRVAVVGSISGAWVAYAELTVPD